MKVLVVGGAGYIGSHMVKYLAQRGCDVTTIDNLSTGYRDAVHFGSFIQADLADKAALKSTLTHTTFDAVMHFASFIQVGESVTAPAKYYQNNLVNTLNLMDAMVETGTNNLIFSSTAAIFGEPHYVPIGEAHPQQPINPYGRTKLMVEQALKDYDLACGLRSICLRYFNAAGADPEGLLGERHEPETHLIPLILQAASGRRPHISVFGRDYDTPDGTCIRDYIHIVDLCQAHWLALSSLTTGAASQVYNLGNGEGFSVQQVIDAAQRVSGKKIKTQEATRRPGDPARLIADSSEIRKNLNWQPEYPEIDTIIHHAWQWERRHYSSS
jgi:UDP-glucose 4-epimerase